MEGENDGNPASLEKRVDQALTKEAEEQPRKDAVDNEKVIEQQKSISGSTVTGDGTKTKDAGSGSANAAAVADADAVFAHLPEREREILKKQLHSPDVKVTFFGLYRYASKLDLFIIFVSAICSIAAGAALPLFTVRGPLFTRTDILCSRMCLLIPLADSFWAVGLCYARDRTELHPIS